MKVAVWIDECHDLGVSATTRFLGRRRDVDGVFEIAPDSFDQFATVMQRKIDAFETALIPWLQFIPIFPAFDAKCIRIAIRAVCCPAAQIPVCIGGLGSAPG